MRLALIFVFFISGLTTLGNYGLRELLEFFISNDFEKKIAAYKKLSEANLIFEKYNEGDFKIPPLF
jgi:hypothetical protein